MLHGSLSMASELRYEADGLECVLRRAAHLLRSANSAAQARAKRCATDAEQDVLLGDILSETIAAMALSVDEARALLLVLGATRETIYECVLWRQAIDEVGGLVRHRA